MVTQITVIAWHTENQDVFHVARDRCTSWCFDWFYFCEKPLDHDGNHRCYMSDWKLDWRIATLTQPTKEDEEKQVQAILDLVQNLDAKRGRPEGRPRR